MTKLKFKPHPSWPNHGWIEGLTEEDDALLHVDTAEAVLEHIEQLEDDLALLLLYMKEKLDRKFFPSGKLMPLWDDFADDYPHTAKVLEKWLEKRHGNDKT